MSGKVFVAEGTEKETTQSSPVKQIKETTSGRDVGKSQENF